MENEKTILIHYIDVRQLPIEEIGPFIQEISDKMSPIEDGLIYYFIPTRETETRVECINPKLIELHSEEGKKQLAKLLKANKSFKDFLDSYERE